MNDPEEPDGRTRHREPLSAPRHRPGTAVRKRGRERAESILDAAGAILIEEGNGELSTRKIAARAGIRPGNLQYYYPCKQELVRALLERHLARATRAVNTLAATGGGSPEERLGSALAVMLAAQESSENCRFFWELWALAARDPEVARAMSGFYESYWRQVVDLLRSVSPDLGRPRAERRAALIVAMLEGLTLFRSRKDPRQLPLPGLEKELRELITTLATATP